MLGIHDLRGAEGGGWGGPLSPCARVSWCHFSHPVSWAGCWVTGLLMGLQGGREKQGLGPRW